jgi:hypothetical protein
MTELNSESQTSTRTGYINRAGTLIAVLQEDTVPLGFQEGFLQVMLRPGEELLGAGGRMLVKLPENNGDYHYYFVDLNGELAFGGRHFYGAESFSEGRAVVRLPAPLDGEGLYLLYGYIDHSGHTVVAPQFGHARRFSEGLAAVELAREELSLRYWGYINCQGEFVIEPKYDVAYSNGNLDLSLSKE